MERFCSNSFFENPKSAIQNRKLAGLGVLAVAFVMCAAVAQAQRVGRVR